MGDHWRPSIISGVSGVTVLVCDAIVPVVETETKDRSAYIPGSMMKRTHQTLNADAFYDDIMLLLGEQPVYYLFTQNAWLPSFKPPVANVMLPQGCCISRVLPINPVRIPLYFSASFV